MSDGIQIALPGDMTPEEAKKAAVKDAAKGMDLRRVAAEKEAAELEQEIEWITNTDVAPYKDDAPLCEDFSGTRAVGRETEHIKLVDPNQAVVPMPAWTHGRCIGPPCARFKEIAGRPICGKALQDLASAQTLGLLSPVDQGVAEIEAEFARWAYPEPEGAEESDDGAE